MMSLSDDKQADVIDAFNTTSRYLNGLTSWLSFVVSAVSLSLSHWYPGSGVVLDCIYS